MADRASDDLLLPFQVGHRRVLGRLVRLGRLADDILTRHAYPEPVSRALGEALAITALLGAALKDDGKLILQTQTDGPLHLIVVNYESPGRLRAYAGFDAARLTAAVDAPSLIGKGHLAMTIDRGGEARRYQGVVPLEGASLSEAAVAYFHQSEQIPSFLRVAVARHLAPAATAGEPRWQWRVGGLLVQYVPPVGSGARSIEVDEWLEGDSGDAWQTARVLAGTVEDHELADPTLPPDRLLYRLFHEPGAYVEPARPLTAYCRCSEARVLGLLGSFSAEALAELREPDGGLSVTCEFCSRRFRIPAEAGI
jgi:molecular chaperone Hsp33